jgi:hypothetical protein
MDPTSSSSSASQRGRPATQLSGTGTAGAATTTGLASTSSAIAKGDAAGPGGVIGHGGAAGPAPVRFDNVSVSGHGAAMVQPVGAGTGTGTSAAAHEQSATGMTRPAAAHGVSSASGGSGGDGAMAGSDYAAEPDVVPTLGSRGVLGGGTT